jgi:hypothetical protein
MTYERLWMNDDLHKSADVAVEKCNPLILLLAGTTRLELATSGVTGRRSNQN